MPITNMPGKSVLLLDERAVRSTTMARYIRHSVEREFEIPVPTVARPESVSRNRYGIRFSGNRYEVAGVAWIEERGLFYLWHSCSIPVAHDIEDALSGMYWGICLLISSDLRDWTAGSAGGSKVVIRLGQTQPNLPAVSVGARGPSRFVLSFDTPEP